MVVRGLSRAVECGGTAPYMDRVLGAMGEQLGAAPSGWPIDDLLEGDLGEYDTPCEPGAYVGCGLRRWCRGVPSAWCSLPSDAGDGQQAEEERPGR